MACDRRKTRCPLERKAVLSTNPSLVLIPRGGRVTLVYYGANFLSDAERNFLRQTGMLAMRRYEIRTGSFPVKLMVDYDPSNGKIQTYALAISRPNSESEPKS